MSALIPPLQTAIPTAFTFYRFARNGGEHTWHGEHLPAPPRVGDSIHPGTALGEEFERCWEVMHVRWVRGGAGQWSLEVGLR